MERREDLGFDPRIRVRILRLDVNPHRGTVPREYRCKSRDAETNELSTCEGRISRIEPRAHVAALDLSDGLLDNSTGTVGRGTARCTVESDVMSDYEHSVLRA